MSSRTLLAVPVLAGVMLALGQGPARAGDDPAQPLVLTLKDHRFTPTELHVPANAPIVIEVLNQDDSAEEFECPTFGIEKVIPGGRGGKVRLHTGAPGRIPIQGEYHADTAQGILIVE
jgi:hypothetical protein